MSFTHLPITSSLREHVHIGHKVAETVLSDGRDKYMDTDSITNLQLREEDIRISASAPVSSTALQNTAGSVDFIPPKNLNSLSNLGLAFNLNNTSVTVRTPMQITITPYVLGGGAATPDGSNYQIGSPYGSSTILAFDAAAGVIQAAIRAINTRYALVTVTGTMVTAIVIVMVGIDPSDISGVGCVELWGIPAGIADGGVGVNFASTITTAFSYGDEVKLVPAPILIDYVILFIGNENVQTLTGQEIWQHIMFMTTREERDRIADICRFDADTNLSTNVVVPATTNYCIVPLLGLALNSRELPIRNISTDVPIRIQVQFKHGATLLESGAAVATGINYYPSTGVIGDITITDCELVGVGEKLGAIEDQLEHRKLASITHDYRFLSGGLGTISSSAYTAGTSIVKDLNITGNIAFMYICPRLTAGVGSSLYTNQAFTSFQITDEGNKSISGYYDKTHTYNTRFEFLTKSPSDSGSISNLYVWSPSKNPSDTLRTGKNLGYYEATGLIRMTLNPNFTTTTTINFYPYIYRYLKIDPMGHVSVSSN